jgi:hypothetical protein
MVRGPMDIRVLRVEAAGSAARTELVRDGQKHSRPHRRPHPGVTEPARSEEALQWITARVPPALVRRIEGHARDSGMSRSGAIRECLAAGIEAIQAHSGVPGRSLEELFGKIELVLLALDLIGPPTLGTQRLLAHWASQEGTVKVSEDELLAELRFVSSDEWDQAIAEGERALGASITEPPDEGR